jgi:hypothetical protein
MEPMGIVAAVALGLVISTVIITYAIDHCRRPRIKESRSDNDLSSLNQDEV